MKKLILFFLIFFVFYSCQKKHESEVKVKSVTKDSITNTKSKKFEMYQMSEMAALMEQMYVYNLEVKKRIINGDTLGKFPKFFNKIYTSKFTTSDDNDFFFQENAKKYIAVQKLIYSDSINAKKHFNDGANACITCHQGKCGGPIPRIKKLFIK